MKTILRTIFAAFLITATIGCSNDDVGVSTAICETATSPITEGLVALEGSGTYNTIDFIDLETHEYQIQINVNGEICSIGYKNPSSYTGDYLMEVIGPNFTSGVQHSFSQTAFEYVAITPLAVTAGDILTVRRTVVSPYTDLNELIGPVLRRTDFNNVAYPLVEGDVTFLSSTFYGAGGPLPDFVQPYIPLGFTY